MYTLQQRIRPSTSAFISSLWLNDQTLTTANVEGKISIFQGSQFSQEQIIDATHKKASLIALHSLGDDHNKTLLSCSFDGAVRIWKPENCNTTTLVDGEEASQPVTTWNECLCEDSFAPIDLMTTATTTNEGGIFANAQANSGKIVINLIEKDRFHKEKSTFIPSGNAAAANVPTTALHFASMQRLVLGKETGVILVADSSSSSQGRIIQSLNGHERQPIQTLDHSDSNSALLLSGGRDGVVCLWDSRAACVAGVFSTGKDGWIGKVRFNPSSSSTYFMATYAGGGGGAAVVRYWDIRAASVAHSWECDDQIDGGKSCFPFPQAEISPSGDRICVFSQSHSAGIYRIPV